MRQLSKNNQDANSKEGWDIEIIYVIYNKSQNDGKKVYFELKNSKKGRKYPFGLIDVETMNVYGNEANLIDTESVGESFVKVF